MVSSTSKSVGSGKSECPGGVPEQTSINRSACGSDRGFVSSMKSRRVQRLTHSFILSALVYITGCSITKNGSGREKLGVNLSSDVKISRPVNGN